VTEGSGNTLIVQSDCSVLLDVHSAAAEDARAAIAPFAELVKSPEHVHTYRLTPLSIWNARAAGFDADQMVASLRQHARYGVPPSVEREILDLAGRYGRVVITREEAALRCSCLDEVTAERLFRDRDTAPFLTARIDKTSFRVDLGQRGILKQALVAAGFPAEDLAGYAAGDPLKVALIGQTTLCSPPA
jgi:DNA excision repair protein ERCC-3